MDERSRVETAFGEAGVLRGLQWAQWSTIQHALAVFDPEAGHDRAFLGQLRFTVLRDRLDRAFQARNYQPSRLEGIDGRSGSDVLSSTLTKDEVERMPQLAHGLVVRDGLNGSPGWRFGNSRFLLSSFPAGGIDQIQWSRKSKTKQGVATTRDPEQLGLEVDPELGLVLPDNPESALAEVQTYVVAHAFDPDSGKSEMFFGRSCYDRVKKQSWYWRFLVDTSLPPKDGRGVTPVAPEPTDGVDRNSDDAADVRLSLKKDPKEGRR